MKETEFSFDDAAEDGSFSLIPTKGGGGVKKQATSGYQEIRGTIFNIQKFSLHDGPGIRTLVFMKGCPLACKWCDNPEGQKAYPQFSFMDIKCVGADKCNAPCKVACPEGAITLSQEGKPQIDRVLCTNCGKCVEACIYGALTILGRRVTVEQVLAEIEQDRPFYNRSEGGISVGGGEPLMQFDFVLQLLKRCRERFLDTALETCGHAPWEHLKAVSQYADLVYYDIKHMDPLRHKAITGVRNELILRNAKRLLKSKSGAEVIIRIPIIPRYNDSQENIEATASFVAEAGGKMIELLPYHKLGISKYGQLGREYKLADVELPDEENMKRLRNIIRSHGLKDMTGEVLDPTRAGVRSPMMR